MQTTAKRLLLTLAGVLAVALVLSLVAYRSGGISDSSAAVIYDPSSNVEEDDPCVAALERYLAATEEGADLAKLNALAAELNECVGPAEVGMVMGPSGVFAIGLSLLYWVVPIVVAVVIGNAIYAALRTIFRRQNH